MIATLGDLRMFQFMRGVLNSPANPQMRDAGPIPRVAVFNRHSWRRQAPGAFVLKPIEISADRVEIFYNAVGHLQRVHSYPIPRYDVCIGEPGP